MPQVVVVDFAAVEPMGHGPVGGDVDGDPVRGDQLNLRGTEAGADAAGDDAPRVPGEQQGADDLGDPVVERNPGGG